MHLENLLWLILPVESAAPRSFKRSCLVKLRVVILLLCRIERVVRINLHPIRFLARSLVKKLLRRIRNKTILYCLPAVDEGLRGRWRLQIVEVERLFLK